MDTEILTSVQPARTALEFPKYRILLHNDDVNDGLHVVRALMLVFKYDAGKSEEIMLKAHHEGVALCAIESLEIAEHRCMLLKACALVATMELQ